MKLTKKNLIYYSIFDDNEYMKLLATDIFKMHLSNPDSNHNVLDKAIGCMVGMAIGDYIGAPLEFMSVSENIKYFRIDNLSYILVNNKFNLKLGQWTDDASMGLCMADSLILNNGFNGADIRIRFWNWWHNGYNNAFAKDMNRKNKHSIGLGGNISESLDDLNKYIGRDNMITSKYEHDSNDSGNGSIMRLAPIPIYYHNNIEKAMTYAEESSYTTHPGIIAADACRFMTYIIISAFYTKETNIKDFLNTSTENFIPYAKTNEIKKLIKSAEPETSTEYCWNWKNEKLGILKTIENRDIEYNGYEVSKEYFGSYCMDGIAIALHALYHTESFDKAIEKAVNFMGDADTIGSIAGQIAGAFYGYKAIGKHLIENLNKWEKNNDEFALKAIIMFNKLSI